MVMETASTVTLPMSSLDRRGSTLSHCKSHDSHGDMRPKWRDRDPVIDC